MIGESWKLEPEVVKQQFAALAYAMKEKHLETYPDYVYKPRKSSDKKRRMSAKKHEKLKTVAALMVQLGFDGLSEEQYEDFSQDRVRFAQSGDNRDYIVLGDADVEEEMLAQMIVNHNESATKFKDNEADGNSMAFDNNYIGASFTTQHGFQTLLESVDMKKFAIDVGQAAAANARRETDVMIANDHFSRKEVEHLQDQRFETQPFKSAEFLREVNDFLNVELNGGLVNGDSVISRFDFDALFNDST